MKLNTNKMNTIKYSTAYGISRTDFDELVSFIRDEGVKPGMAIHHLDEKKIKACYVFISYLLAKKGRGVHLVLGNRQKARGFGSEFAAMLTRVGEGVESKARGQAFALSNKTLVHFATKESAVDTGAKTLIIIPDDDISTEEIDALTTQFNKNNV